MLHATPILSLFETQLFELQKQTSFTMIRIDPNNEVSDRPYHVSQN